MFATMIRYIGRKPKSKTKPIELKTPPKQTQTITRTILRAKCCEIGKVVHSGRKTSKNVLVRLRGINMSFTKLIHVLKHLVLLIHRK